MAAIRKRRSRVDGIGGADEACNEETARPNGEPEGWLMSLAKELPLELWIEPGSEPIAGWLAQPGGERQPFGGWVELTAAIESARRDVADAALVGRERG
jgi:hypothetical protein